MKLGHHQNVLESPRVLSRDGSFRRSGSGFSTDRRSDDSVGSKLGSSPRSRTGRLLPKGLKDFAKKFVDKEAFTIKLQDWLLEKTDKSVDGRLLFESPFQLEELRKFDYALEGVVFQQLLRMPCASYAPSTHDGDEADAYLAVEDFLHTSAECLWKTFWRKDGSMPFSVSCPYGVRSKFHTAEKAIVRGKVGDLCGAALLVKDDTNSHARWDHVAELALFRHSVGHHSQGKEPFLSVATIGEALFYGFHMLLSRRLRNSHLLVNNDCVHVLVVDCEYGAVVKISGDLGKLDSNTTRVYDCAADWIKHAEVKVSPVDRIWNKMGNANWGDFGTLNLLLATFHSIVQCKGPPPKSITELAANHSMRLQKRRIESRLSETHGNGSNSFDYHQNNRIYGEILEIEDELEPVISKEKERMKLELGTVIWLEDSQGQMGFQIHDISRDGRNFLYSATSLEDPSMLLAVYVGAHPSQLAPSWEDMSMWYQVQRQTKVLNVLKQRGISSMYLPQLVASGKVMHPGSCYKQSPGGRCNHPWCGTPVLVYSPVGEPLSSIIARDGAFTSEEALQCCHDILSALQNAASASIQHGDICPEHVIRVMDAERGSFYVLVDWGHAVLEDRDSPAINLQFSSTYALQEGKLCPASDAESLVYLLYYLCSGAPQQLDSIEAALQWRERSWAQRYIQQQLGEISALLKAFADYVDSLCGTPYPVDYEIWIRRLSRAMQGNNHGKSIDYSASSVRSDDVAESSGTSAASLT
ncbi:uncharacterized protein LOC131032735 isoform X1 [Cryptomeria japonica]|uniref:uncharacterized protein LOC131032735 isoform X1 n=1 Tax=Cryptomeria japonica TaxID=3369 RepID=UPI0025ACE079|nr:uncharacterized protein LOC131032735 isoform X1 [Cryptomeria japonica]XP_057819758.1 uncharacterized protein LOC131032735 isoform X1 [Cryptomeria japonica]XP_057819759.1 uncharacterized protein LOC131032735 isoform X1 [Cryptomeria japonica]XP_057819761.1 uncharacterized protein LOC131032735 isoform X1 [Cryptomeria japonica]